MPGRVFLILGTGASPFLRIPGDFSPLLVGLIAYGPSLFCPRRRSFRSCRILLFLSLPASETWRRSLLPPPLHSTNVVAGTPVRAALRNRSSSLFAHSPVLTRHAGDRSSLLSFVAQMWSVSCRPEHSRRTQRGRLFPPFFFLDFSLPSECLSSLDGASSCFPSSFRTHAERHQAPQSRFPPLIDDREVRSVSLPPPRTPNANILPFLPVSTST